MERLTYMELNLIEKFTDPGLIAEMSLVDKLKATLVTGLTGLCVAVVVLIALMLIVILVRQLVGRYELKSEYRRQVHRARKLRNAKLDKRKSEAEQHGFETIRDEVRSAAVDPASSGGEGRKNQEADQKTETQSGADRPDEAVVAAIVAAISALEGTPAERIQIRSIVHRPYEEAVWKSYAGMETRSGEGRKR